MTKMKINVDSLFNSDIAKRAFEAGIELNDDVDKALVTLGCYETAHRMDCLERKTMAEIAALAILTQNETEK
jgi:hypothetical protein